MKHDSFDQEVSQLYQQRKQAIEAPSILLNHEGVNASSSSRHTKINSLIKMFMVLIGAGGASFGILAIISHLAATKASMPFVNSQNNNIEIVEFIEAKEVAPLLIPIVPIPPKPMINENVASSEIERVDVQLFISPSNDFKNELTNVVALPKLHAVESTLMPEFKVLPKYPARAIRDQQSGSIKLSYRVTSKGRVVDIAVEESEVNQQLKYAARQALSQWRYSANSKVTQRQEVVFEFTLADNG